MSSVAPPVVCGAQRTTALTLSGAGFAPLPLGVLTAAPGLELPAVFVKLRSAADGSGAGPEIRVPDSADGTGHVRWLSAEQMSFEVFPGMQAGLPGGPDLTPGLYDVTVANPDRRRATLSGALAVTLAPTLATAVPSPSCNAQGDATYTLSGTTFLQIDGTLPTVLFTAPGAQAPAAEIAASAARDCAPLPAPTGVMLAGCRTIDVTAQKGALPPGSYQISVHNPRDAACVTTEQVRVAVVPPPTISEVRSATICTAQADSEILLIGAGFLTITEGGATRHPAVRIGDRTFPAVAEECAPILDAPSAESCTRLRVTVPQGALPVGKHPLRVRNPEPAACQVERMLEIESVPPPVLETVTPQVMCSGGGTLVLTGQGFRPGATVLISNLPSTRVTVEPDGKRATADFAGPIPPGGLYPVTFQNADSCQSSLADVVRITPGPAILFVDPPAVPAGIAIQATVRASGIHPPVARVETSPAGQGVWTTRTIRLDAAHPNRVLVSLPATLAPGAYDVRLGDQSTCPAFLASAFTVVKDPTLMVTAVTPPFGSTALDTAVIVEGDRFVSTPRVYLNQPGNSAGAQAVFSVTYQSGKSLTGVVRPGLPAGTYDAIVINPDGEFGIKVGAYRVTAADQPPPVVTGIAPSSVVTGVATPVTIAGSGFRAGAAVTLTCEDAAGVKAPPSTATVTSVAAGKIQAMVVGSGILCIVRVTNQDGTYFDYSAIGVTNASLNLTGFRAGTSMTVERRGCAAIAGRPTAVARFVYAVGGDSGADNAPKASVEAAPTSLSGTLGAWFVTSQALPRPRSFLGLAGVGRFLYAVGGFTGAAAAREVYRAEILSPLRAPQVSDVDIDFDEDEGLSPGVYIYRISAVMAAADENNPGGETLAGDFFPIHLPKVNGRLQVVLLWPKETGAKEYRIYRSVKAGDPAGSERLLAVVPQPAGQPEYRDDGRITPQGAAPLPLGSTGTWRPMPLLATARIGAGVAAAQDPDDASRWYLYAVGGSSGTLAAPAPLDTVEFLPITVSAMDGGQTVGAWTAATQRLRSARWLAPAITATSDNNSIITPAGATYLWALSGSGAAIGTSDDRIDVALVQAGGQPAAFVDPRAAGGGLKRPGFGAVLVNNQVMAFGGISGGAAANNSVTGELTGPIQLKNFNALGNGTLSVPRALHGTALESAFIYQLGGATSVGIGTAQRTTEQTVW